MAKKVFSFLIKTFSNFKINIIYSKIKTFGRPLRMDAYVYYFVKNS